MAQASRSTRGSLPFDLESFLRAVKRRLDSGALSFADAVTKVTAKHDLTPELEAEATARGLVDIAREHLGSGVREAIMRTVEGVAAHPTDGKVVHVEVTRSTLRDWPVVTVGGYRRLEECSTEEVEAHIQHLDATIAGLRRRRSVMEAVVTRAKRAGVWWIGDLPDGVLDSCIELVEGS